MGVFNTKIVIAIDGPAGSGKSSAARLLAKRLGYLYLDTGALYRAVGWKTLNEGLNVQDAAALNVLCEELELTIHPDGNGMRVSVNGRDVTGELRTPEVSRAAAAVAMVPAVRQRLMKIQRAIVEGPGAQGGVVVEGRDIGTVVFPDAPFKFFLEASPEVRVRRRHLELEQQGLKVDLSATRTEIDIRDLKDASREIAPMKPAADAVRIDSTALALDGVVTAMLEAIEQKRSGIAGRSPSG